jgi:hypothetical protein
LRCISDSHAAVVPARIHYDINPEIHMRELEKMEIEAVSGGLCALPVQPDRDIRLSELASEIDPMERPVRE